MQLGAFIITYNRPQILKATTQAVLAQTRPPDHVLIVDNGGLGSESEAVARAFPDGKVSYHAMGRNAGPAGAAAEGLRQLYERGFDWMYWVDDDDPPPTPDALQRLVALLRRQRDEARAGVVGATGNRWDWTRGRRVRPEDDELEGVMEIDLVAGNSMPIVSRDVVETVGYPRSDLFFGFEEGEYCLRIRRAGFKILADGEFWKEIRTADGRLNLQRSRSPAPKRGREDMWREYYSVRNYIHMMQRTFGRPDLSLKRTLKTAAKSVVSWANGPDYALAYSRLMARAVIDGYRGRMGMTVKPGSVR